MLLLLSALLIVTRADSIPYGESAPGPGGHIVGGEEAPRGSYPWQMSIERCTALGCAHACGAVLISEYWAITAAHCSPTGATANLEFVAGQHTRGEIPRGDKRRLLPARISPHPLYSRGNGNPNDIAVVQFFKPAPIDGVFVAAAVLPPSHPADYTQDECWISGWGATKAGGSLPEQLQHARVNILTTEQCRASHGQNVIQDLHICVYDRESQKNAACLGDSGGPVQCRVGGLFNWEVAGVYSWGVSGCPPTTPSVYARTSYFRNWIREMTGV